MKIPSLIGLSITLSFSSMAFPAENLLPDKLPQWTLRADKSKLTNPDLIKVCIIYDTSNAGFFSSGELKTIIGETTVACKEKLLADVNTRTFYINFDPKADIPIAYNVPKVEVNCSPQIVYDFYSPCSSIFFHKLSEDSRNRRFSGYFFNKVLTEAKTIIALEEIIANRASERKKQLYDQYRKEFDEVKYLTDITRFETKYELNDPDNLIIKLYPLKHKLLLEKYRDDFRNASTASELLQFISTYADNDPESLIPIAEKKLATRKRQDQQAEQQEQKLRDITNQRDTEIKKQARLSYIKNLHATRIKNIIFDDSYSRSIVENYHIDCKLPDKRYMSLLNVLLYAAKNIHDAGGDSSFNVTNRNKSIRVYHTISKQGRTLVNNEIYLEINQWGDIRFLGVQPVAILTQCINTTNPIWNMPND